MNPIFHSGTTSCSHSDFILHAIVQYPLYLQPLEAKGMTSVLKICTHCVTCEGKLPKCLFRLT